MLPCVLFTAYSLLSEKFNTGGTCGWREQASVQICDPSVTFFCICGEVKVLPWAGNSSADTEVSVSDEYAFMGALIIQEVIKELVGKGLSTAKVLLLAGSRYVSAGLPQQKALWEEFSAASPTPVLHGVVQWRNEVV